MTYFVSAQGGGAGAIATNRPTLEEAVDIALEYQSNGFTNVTIKDGDGNLVEDSVLERLFNERN